MPITLNFMLYFLLYRTTTDFLISFLNFSRLQGCKRRGQIPYNFLLCSIFHFTSQTSMTQGWKEASTMKSAPYSSKELCRCCINSVAPRRTTNISSCEWNDLDGIFQKAPLPLSPIRKSGFSLYENDYRYFLTSDLSPVILQFYSSLIIWQRENGPEKRLVYILHVEWWWSLNDVAIPNYVGISIRIVTDGWKDGRADGRSQTLIDIPRKQARTYR